LPARTLTAVLLVAMLALANPQSGYRLLSEPCDEELSSYRVVDQDGVAVDLAASCSTRSSTAAA